MRGREKKKVELVSGRDLGVESLIVVFQRGRVFKPYQQGIYLTWSKS